MFQVCKIRTGCCTRRSNMATANTERAIDIALVLFLFSPLVICYWSSTWTILDLYLFPSNQITSGWVSVCVSISIMGMTFLVQSRLNGYIRPEQPVRYVIVTRIYTYVTAFAFVNNWRGLWMLMDTYSGVTLTGACWNLFGGVTGLVLLRAYRNVLAPPGAWSLDVNTETHFTVLTLFRSKRGGIFNVIDVVFCVTVVSTFVLLVWRGKWLLLQLSLALVLSNNLWQAVITTAAAHVLQLVLYITQFPARKLSAYLHTERPILQVVFDNVWVFITCYSSVMYWQGMWTLARLLLEGSPPDLTQWLIHIIAFGGLMVLRLSTTLQFPGYFIDGEFPQGLVLTPPYVSTFLMTPSYSLKNSTETFHGMSVTTISTEIPSPDNATGDILESTHM
ncbi:uncharacterized protein LOC124283347 [Haliotis rubra]|uniref:uncharacterized protein LOC124283347 n=1 Tax=Haliotis rubra TaxID=36100 RepID=UPI001EE5E073|nr:uncharacterized protein LOC124283347 [Haliotis rubra]